MSRSLPSSRLHSCVGVLRREVGVLVEKLLRSCPKIKNIYLLMRPKRGQDVTSRLSELIQSPLFETLRRDRPQELNKIVPIVGDITDPELGVRSIPLGGNSEVR
ncbi:unnamed protein product [Leptidea sinapis]|uniref:Fatty acyl-CoA reductase n=1 Tax=Leptidea sinapis TaxID=189913 RepID=A0A5E4R0D1_9NEOP|nr:unnamed protein product [Leptidea sinapis]